VTDAEVEALIEDHGEKQTVALVQLLAWSNFQDRLVLALGLEPGPDAAAPPLEVRFRKDSAVEAPPRIPPTEKVGLPERVGDAQWLSMSFADLQKHLEAQRNRPARIRVPPTGQGKGQPAPDGKPVRRSAVVWGQVCAGYQPELAAGWSACMSAFRAEAKQDRIFQNCLFWVVTRTQNCFY
jgi:hypothetical protein